jgi:SecD/SecF fusion protein
MKTHFIIVTIIFVAFLFVGCKTKENFDFKVSVIPQTSNSMKSLSDMNKSAEVINKRLNYFFEIPQENIKLDIAETQILLTLHNIDTSKVRKITNVITSNNTLEFWETYENSEIIGYLTKADNLLRAMRTPGSTLKEEKQPNPDLTGKSTVKTAVLDSRKQFSDQNPLFSILGPRITTTGEPLPSCMIGLANEKDTSMINRYLKMDKIKALFPNDLKFCWDSNPYKYDPLKALYGLHAIKVTWAKITRENISRCIAVVYNGSVRTYPRVRAEITGGKTEITGDFTTEEANDLVYLLKSGELPFELKIGEAQIIKSE